MLHERKWDAVLEDIEQEDGFISCDLEGSMVMDVTGDLMTIGVPFQDPIQAKRLMKPRVIKCISPLIEKYFEMKLNIMFDIRQEPKPDVNKVDFENIFTYLPPFGDQVAKYHDIRHMGKTCAEVIDALVPDSREKDIAVEKLREAVMWANAGIACNG